MNERDAQNAVERSLEEFILRANTSLPPPAPQIAPAVRAISAHRKQKRAGARPAAAKTLVVLGPQTPLAEETEIVTRLPANDLAPRRKSWSSLRLALAFVAGAAIVLLLTRLISGGPRPVKPAPVPAVTPPAAVTSAPPPIVVVPIPVSEPVPAAAPAAMPPAAAPVAVEKPTAPRASVRAARRPARPAPPARAVPDAKKKPSGLVDPFAD